MTSGPPTKAGLYSGKDSAYFRTLNPLVVSLLEPGGVMLEVGCAGGQMGKFVRERSMFRETYGIEMDPAAAADAAEWYTRVHTGDLESFDLSVLPEADVAVCADVLEHLVDPWEIFGRLIARIRQPSRYR